MVFRSVLVTVSRSTKETQFITSADAATGIISRIRRQAMSRVLSVDSPGEQGSFRFLSEISREISPHSSLRETAAIAPAAARGSTAL